MIDGVIFLLLISSFSYHIPRGLKGEVNDHKKDLIYYPLIHQFYRLYSFILMDNGGPKSS